MLTLLEPHFPEPTGNPTEDYRALVAALKAWHRTLNQPDVLTIDSAKINGTVIGQDTNGAKPGKFTTLVSTGNATVGDALTDSHVVNGSLGVNVTPVVRLHVKAGTSTFVNAATENTNGGTDEKIVDHINNGTTFSLRMVNDAYNASNSAYDVIRSGYTVTSHTWRTGSGTEKLLLDTNALKPSVPVRGADGSASAPAYSYSGDTDTGAYRIGADNIGWALGGTKYLDLSTTELKFVSGATNTSIGFGSISFLNGSQVGSLTSTSLSMYTGTIGSHQVVGQRKTGYTNLMTGTANRATAYDTSTITLQQLAERVKAIQDDLHASAGHGLIGA